jgi:hypothetical protein
VGGYNGTQWFVAKYDATGNLVWTRLFGTFGIRVSVIAESSDIYVAYADSSDGGRVQAFDSNSTLLWTQSCSCVPMEITGDGTGVYVVGTVQTASLVPPDGFLTKYGPNGNQLWTTKVTPPAGTEALVGASELRASADSSALYLTETTGDGRGTIMKYDSNGNHIWSLVLPWIIREVYAPAAVLTLQDGSVYVGGSQGAGSAFIAEISGSSSLVLFGINP